MRGQWIGMGPAIASHHGGLGTCNAPKWMVSIPMVLGNSRLLQRLDPDPLNSHGPVIAVSIAHNHHGFSKSNGKLGYPHSICWFIVSLFELALFCFLLFPNGWTDPYHIVGYWWILLVCVFIHSTHILLASMICILSDPPFCCLKHVNSSPLQSFPLISKTPQKPWSSRWFGHTWHVIKVWFILVDGRMELFPMNYPYHIPKWYPLVKSKDYPPS